MRVAIAIVALGLIGGAAGFEVSRGDGVKPVTQPSQVGNTRISHGGHGASGYGPGTVRYSLRGVEHEVELLHQQLQEGGR